MSSKAKGTNAGRARIERGGAMESTPGLDRCPRGPMKFRIGPYAYVVRIVDDLRDCDGNRTAGCYSWTGREILISGRINPAARIDALAHELGHGWRTHFGHSRDIEEDANFLSSFAVDLHRQLLLQGGEGRLIRMKPSRAKGASHAI